MKSIRRTVAITVMASLVGTAGVYAQTTAATATAPPAADNTHYNKTDPSNRAATADDQKNDKQDLMLTKRIRSSIIADKSLSTYAHNIKIVAVDGNVTLNGVVRSQAEKDTLASKAQALVKGGNVTNDLKVAPAQ